MKSDCCILLSVLIFALISQGSCYLYSNEDPYSDFLSKNTDFTQRHISGFNLKITDDVLNTLTNKLRNAMRSDAEMEGDSDKLIFEDTDDSDEFGNVDLTDWDTMGSIPEDSKPIELAELKINTEYCKREFLYSKVFATVGKGQKYFSKIYQSTKEGGKLGSTIDGSLNTTLTSTSSGNVGSKLNTTVWSKGKDYNSSVSVDSSLKSSTADKMIGKHGDKFSSSSNVGVTSTVTAGNMTFDMKTSIKTSSETFRAPFRVYLTLFESMLNISGKVSEGAEIKGEVTSRVVYSKNGKTLTKSKIRGYVIYEVETPGKACGISMFKSKSHTWSKVQKSSTNANGDVTVGVWTSTKTRVYGKASTKDAKVFSGSGVVTFQKAEMVIPAQKILEESSEENSYEGNVHEHEIGVNFIAKHGLGDYLSSVRGITSKIVGL